MALPHQGVKERWVATGSVVALVAGGFLGHILYVVASGGSDGGSTAAASVATQVVHAFQVAGDLMLVRPLMLLVLPLIFTSVCSGVTSLGDPSRLGKLGMATAALHLHHAAGRSAGCCAGLRDLSRHRLG
ncbi:MAG: cation:dicarboxylase symporter family transporter [Phycisphaerales bacterium]